ncbi:MAG: F0F1 ATP synthase subunit delta [Vulcanibacillus sp.]
MIEGLAAKRYAKALFEITKDSELLEKVEQDLHLVIEVIYSSEEIKNFLNHPQITREVKRTIIDSTFGQAISQITKNMLFQLIDNNRQEALEGILSEYIKMANNYRGIIDVEAISVIALSDADKEKVTKSFAEKFNKQVRLKNTVDPLILGGMVIRIGDKVYDGSIKTKLKVMKRNLTTSRV